MRHWGRGYTKWLGEVVAVLSVALLDTLFAVFATGRPFVLKIILTEVHARGVEGGLLTAVLLALDEACTLIGWVSPSPVRLWFFCHGSNSFA